MPLSFLDIGLVSIMLLSGFLATMRGFTREVLSIASWAAAAGAAVFAYLKFKDFARAEIQPAYLADAVLIGGTFLGVLIIVSFITARISDAILDSRIGAIDRTLGFVFGLARGFVIVVIAFLFFNWLVPQQSQPRWVTESRSRGYLQTAGNMIMQYLPEDPERALQQFRRNREGEGAPADQAPASRPGAAPAAPQRSDAPAAVPAAPVQAMPARPVAPAAPTAASAPAQQAQPAPAARPAQATAPAVAPPPTPPASQQQAQTPQQRPPAQPQRPMTLDDLLRANQGQPAR